MKTALRRIILITALATMMLAVALLSAPTLLNTYVLPRLLEVIPVSDKTLALSALTPFSACGRLRLSGEGGPVLTIPRFEITYRPAALLRRTIASLVLDHATLHLVRGPDGTVSLPGMPAIGSPSGAGRDGPSPAPPPFRLESLILEHCSLVLHEAGRPDLRLTLSARADLPLDAAAPNGSPLPPLRGSFVISDAVNGSGSFQLTPASREQRLTFTLDIAAAPGIEPYTPAPLSAATLGALSAGGAVTFDPATRAVNTIEVNGRVTGFHPRLGPLALQGAAPDGAVSFSVSGSPDSLTFTLGHLAASAPLPIEAALTGGASIRSGEIRARGRIDALVQPVALQGDGESLGLGLDLDATWNVRTGWQARLSGACRGSERPVALGAGLSAVIPSLHLNASLAASSAQLAAELTVTGTPFTLEREGSLVLVSETILEGRLERQDDRLTARLSGTLPELVLPSRELRLGDLQFDLPLHYPPEAALPAAPGSLSVGSLSLRGAPLLSLSARLAQQGAAFQAGGSVTALFDPALAISLTAGLTPATGEGSLTWSLPPSRLASSALPATLGLPEGLGFAGVIAADGALALHQNRLNGWSRATLEAGTVTGPEKNIVVSDIACALELPHLPELISGPSQLCRIGSVEAGRLNFSDGTITFRLEAPDTLFIEKSRFNWCQGSLESGSLRLSGSEREIDTTLYCSRINLADLLNQFGLDQTEGQGALNGKLPIRLSKAGLHFDDGFLFSTPGTGGIVRFTNTDLLRQGMGAVGDTGYLSYSMKALEDFAYSWTKLSFDSSGEELLLAMELDGKPRTPLPFAFENGMIVESSQGNGLQYPIRLDVNFRLPLAQLFQFGQNIQSIMENR